MSFNIWELPFDALHCITDRLSNRDLLKLRLVNKKTKKTIESLPNWRETSLKRWLVYDDQLQEEQMKQTIVDFKYFLQRSREDKNVQVKLRKIQTGQLSDKQTLDLIYSFSDKYGTRLTPVLNKLLKRPNPEKNLRVGYFAKIILEVARRKSIYRYFDALENNPDGTINQIFGSMEQFFFIMSHGDKAFENLLHYRKLIMNNVKERLRYDLAFLKLNPTKKIVKIHDIFIEEVGKLNGGKYTHTMYTEDSSILRVYAGENLGFPLIRLAIVEKIAREFGVKCLLLKFTMGEMDFIHANGMMKVKDNSYREGFSYVKAPPYFRIHHNIKLTALSTSDYQASLAAFGITEPVATLLRPFSAGELFTEYAIDIHGVKPRLLIEEGKTKKELYPRSNYELDESHLIAVQTYFHSIRSETVGFMSYPLNSGGSFSTPKDMFLYFLSHTLPYELGVIHNPIFFRNKSKAMIQKECLETFSTVVQSLILRRYDLIEKIENSKRLPCYFPGQTLIADQGVKCIVLGCNMADDRSSDMIDEYLIMDTRVGSIIRGSFAPTDTVAYIPTIEDVAQMVDSCWNIGLYFERFDTITKRFIPIKPLLDLVTGSENFRTIRSPTEVRIAIGQQQNGQSVTSEMSCPFENFAGHGHDHHHDFNHDTDHDNHPEITAHHIDPSQFDDMTLRVMDLYRQQDPQGFASFMERLEHMSLEEIMARVADMMNGNSDDEEDEPRDPGLFEVD